MPQLRVMTAAPATGQLVLKVERPEGTPPLTIRAAAEVRVVRADCDWSRDGFGWRSANGWLVRPARISTELIADGPAWPSPNGWEAVAPDGLGEWWAEDAVTAMTRAEGGL